MPEIPLTQRQLQCVALFGQGIAAKQIARELHVTFSTVATHLEQARARLDVQSTAQAYLTCIRNGWLLDETLVAHTAEMHLFRRVADALETLADELASRPREKNPLAPEHRALLAEFDEWLRTVPPDDPKWMNMIAGLSRTMRRLDSHRR